MDLGTSTMVIGGAIGLALAGFGARMLVTGRAPAGTVKAFRRVRDAGLYHLLFGVALMILVAGTFLPGAALITASAVVAVALVVVAVVRYRPRPKKQQTEEQT